MHVIFSFGQYPTPLNTGKGLRKRLSSKWEALSRSSLQCPQRRSISSTIKTTTGEGDEIYVGSQCDKNISIICRMYAGILKL